MVVPETMAVAVEDMGEVEAEAEDMGVAEVDMVAVEEDMEAVAAVTMENKVRKAIIDVCTAQ